MNRIQIIRISFIAITVLVSGCANMSTRDENTAIGAGVGAIGGAILTGGGTVGTLGGAAVGAVIGHESSH
jgi:osmotically inducible lipoprotein OsmB